MKKSPASAVLFLQMLIRYTHLRAEDLVGRLGEILIHKKAPYGVGR